MSVQWNWYDHQHNIICFVFHDPWNGKEFFTANQEASEAIIHFDWIVDAIFDLSQSAVMPKNIVSGTVNMVRHSRDQPNQGIAVIVGANTGAKLLMQLIQQLTPPEILFIADDLEAALNIIEQQQQKR